MKKNLILLLFLIPAYMGAVNKNSIKSPDQQIEVELITGDTITWALKYKGVTVVQPSRIDLIIKGKEQFKKAKLKRSNAGLVLQNIKPDVPVKFASQTVQFSESVFEFTNGFGIIFRVYNEGVAYCIKSTAKKEFTIDHEMVNLKFSPESEVLFPQETSLLSHYERSYLPFTISEINDTMFCSLPALVTVNNTIRVGITEAGLTSYPHLFLKGSHGKGFTSLFPKYPIKLDPDPKRKDRNQVLVEEASYMAKIGSPRNLPWRVFMVSDDDRKLVENNLPVWLNGSSLIETDWIKPGKVAWDWWNANNVYGVDFKSGINTETYKYYIDFAAEFGLEYIILDEGWSKTVLDITEFAPEMDVEEIIRYGKEKNVGVILWVLWGPLEENMEQILDYYQQLGAVGIKVDFMQRADQPMVDYYERVAREAAKRKLLVNYHGAFKPSGIEANYPNIVNYEGVKGLEHHKWSADITPDHNLTLPFTRQLAGPMDYTPGAMRNMGEKDFHISFIRPMSMGTRAHQAAMYVIYEAPLQMLSDVPSNYLREKEYTHFISRFPTTWHKLKVLEARVGDYIVEARQHDDKWYLGGMTDWQERSFTISFDFLDANRQYKLTVLTDGINANTMAEDFTITESTIDATQSFNISMAKGGGFAAIIEPLEK
jgi:alpha-glucosidase